MGYIPILYSQSVKMQNSAIFMPGEWGSKKVDLDPLFPLKCPCSLAVGQLTFPIELALLCQSKHCREVAKTQPGLSFPVQIREACS